MIVSWMTYAMVCAALLSVGALAAEHAARALRIPLRGIWSVAIAASLLWPSGAMILARVNASRQATSPVLLDVQRVTAIAATAAVGPSRVITLDRVLLVLWIAASVLLLLRIGAAMWSIQRRRHEWEPVSMDGVSVRLSDSAGPAVVGFHTMDVVIPSWLRSLEPHLRAMVLTHESEHRSARDPLLLFAAGLGLALTPWNLAMWWQARRLRLAIELDCDARVLRRHGDRERYAMLLLTIAQRRSVLRPSHAAMLSEPASQLERRIEVMHAVPQARPKRRAAIAFLGAATAIVAACAIGAPERTAGPKSEVQPRPATSRQPYFEFQVERAAQVAPGNGAPRYPDILRSAEQEGAVLAQFVVRSDGSVDTSTIKILKTTHQLFAINVRGWLAGARFNAAEVGGASVSQVVQMPFQFNLAGGTTYEAAAPMTADQIRAVRQPQLAKPLRPDTNQTTSTVDTLRVRQSVSNEGLREVSVPNVRQFSSRRIDSTGTPYVEFQIEKRAQLLKGAGAPAYPPELRQQGLEGDVLAQFVVSEAGVADLTTFKALKSKDPLFTAAVREWLATAQFSPAEVGGTRVKQLMQMPFSFNLSP